MNIEKSARKYAIELYKHEDRKGIAGANYYHDDRDCEPVNRQYLCDGYIAVVYQNPVKEIVDADLEKAIDLNRIIGRKQMNPLNPANLPTYKELKLLQDIAKERNIKKKDAIIRIKSGQYYNLSFLIKLFELTDFHCDWEHGEYAEVEDNRNGILYLHKETAERGEIDGVLMPMRVTDVANVVKDYTLEGE